MNNAENDHSSPNTRPLTDLHDKAAHVCDLLKVMSNEWRLIILCQLSEGDKSVGELQSMLDLSQSALSQHLAVLRRERVVRARKHGQSVTYSLQGDEAIRVMETLHDMFCGEMST